MPSNSDYKCGVDLHRPVLSIGEVASTFVDLQGALTWAFTFILLHSEEEKRKSSVQKGSSITVLSTGHDIRMKYRTGRNTDLWQLRHRRSTVLQAQNARESHVSLTMPAKALVPGIRVRRYLEQWLPWTRLVRSPCERNIQPQLDIWKFSRNEIAWRRMGIRHVTLYTQVPFYVSKDVVQTILHLEFTSLEFEHQSLEWLIFCNFVLQYRRCPQGGPTHHHICCEQCVKQSWTE